MLGKEREVAMFIAAWWSAAYLSVTYLLGNWQSDCGALIALAIFS
jgi:hypothetical protein